MLKKLSLTLLAASAILTTAATTAPAMWGGFNSCDISDNGGSSGFTAHVDVTEYDPIVAYVDITLTDSSDRYQGSASFTIDPCDNNQPVSFSAGGYDNFIAPGSGVTWGDVGQGSCTIGYGTVVQ